MNVIEVSHLHKRYGNKVAVADISFTVADGEIFGMVGPNGAGKTTTIECVEGLRPPDKGQIRVLGLDPQKDGYALREQIGVQLQESALPERLKVGEAMELFAAFYKQKADWRALLERLGLTEKVNTPFAKLSGGQKQRLFIALALINMPKLVFLDELTTGLDPQSRRNTWDLVREIREQGRTVFLTTHYMEEAEQLCDRVAIVDQGRIVALDAPENLVRSLGVEQRVVFRVNGRFDPTPFYNIPGVTRVEATNGDGKVVVYSRDNEFLTHLLQAMISQGIQYQELHTEKPSLEDVFLNLTGRQIRN